MTVPWGRKKAQPEEPEDREPVQPLTKEERWRFDALIAAGYRDTQALMIALDRSIDLHEAVRLRGKTDLAYEILS